MDKLVITVTTDSTGSYPRNPYLTPCTDARGVAEEYLRALDAGAAVVHTHGAYTHDPVIQPDGRKLSIPDMEGWRDISASGFAPGSIPSCSLEWPACDWSRSWSSGRPCGRT